MKAVSDTIHRRGSRCSFLMKHSSCMHIINQLGVARIVFMFTTDVYRAIYTLSATDFIQFNRRYHGATHIHLHFQAVRAAACIIRTHLVEHLVCTVDVSCSAVALERETRSLLFSS